MGDDRIISPVVFAIVVREVVQVGFDLSRRQHEHLHLHRILTRTAHHNPQHSTCKKYTTQILIQYISLNYTLA